MKKLNTLDFESLKEKGHYKQIVPLILFLEKQEKQISLPDLASALKMKRNKILNLARRLEPFNVIISIKIRDEYHYSLNDKGREFAIFIKENG